jgi:hypothetical protein
MQLMGRLTNCRTLLFNQLPSWRIPRNNVDSKKERRVVKYRFAKTIDGVIVDAQSLAENDRPDVDFLCIGCDRHLIPKVKGMKRQPHFAHHPGTTCALETYLHMLGKRVFYDVFNECVASQVPFEIELQHPQVCRRFESSLGAVCVAGAGQTKLHDLTSHFNCVELEQREGEFVPDLLLTGNSNPNLKVFIEIAVTHFLTEKKATSNERIIEIPIESEEDLERIRCRKLTSKTARFINFVTESQSLVEADCRCATRAAFAFFVYTSGKCVLDKSTLAGLVAKRQKLGDSVTYFKLFRPPEHSQIEYIPAPGPMFRQAVEQAHREGFPLKNCYLCRYQGDSFAGTADCPIYCKYFKKSCNSNEAVTCTAFRLPAPQ